ncbi:MAG: ribonuclease [Burkholderiales bacterium]|nr:ribonuclease [Burkholderiales bacterium]
MTGLRVLLLWCLFGVSAADVSARDGNNTQFAPRQLQEIPVSELPREARETLRLIERGGPFPYDRDGVEFRNFEKLLPRKARGYYREYTVRTPGVKHRGARRIVAGANGERYYTDDHYRSFRMIIKNE